jgi:Cu(I)/Ag(I) efflux system protein CusF
VTARSREVERPPLATGDGHIDLLISGGIVNMRRIALISWLVILSATVGGAVWGAQRIAAQPCAAAAPTAHLASLQPVEEFPLTAGKIVAVDAKDGRLTVRHRGVARFYLEPGTFIFHVEDRTLLTGLTPGDKIQFGVERNGKRYDITQIENSN